MGFNSGFKGLNNVGISLFTLQFGVHSSASKSESRRSSFAIERADGICRFQTCPDNMFINTMPIIPDIYLGDTEVWKE